MSAPGQHGHDPGAPIYDVVESELGISLPGVTPPLPGAMVQLDMPSFPDELIPEPAMAATILTPSIAALQELAYQRFQDALTAAPDPTAYAVDGEESPGQTGRPTDG